MITLTRKQSRELDQIAIERYGFSGLVLMENAGRGVVDVLLRVDPRLATNPGVAVVILCGKGNNGGDGFVIARHLAIRGVRSKVVLLASPTELRGEALTNYEILRHTEVPVLDLSSTGDLAVALSAAAEASEWIVDAMLGTGAQGEPREPYATAIQWANAQTARRLAVDVPSGLDCDTGQAAEPTFCAAHTCTFAAAKQGFAAPSAASSLGQLQVVSIGTPSSLLDEVATMSC